MHRLSKRIASAVGLVALLLPAAALAFSVTTSPPNSQTLKRFTVSKVYYHLHPKCSEDLPTAACLDILRKGFEGWMEPSCGGLKFVEGYHCNLASKTCLHDKKFGKPVACTKDVDCPSKNNLKVMPIGYNPNKLNEMVFTEGNDWKMSSFVLGVTVAWSNSWNGSISEADIAFNGLHHKWTNNPFEAKQYLQDLLSVSIHEQGHFFGVMHVLGDFDTSDYQTMAPNVFPKGISQTLSVDDKRAICFLNPSSGSYSCKNDDECPYVVHKSGGGQEKYTAKYVCSKGKCIWGSVAAAPKAPLGGNCQDNDGCQTGLFCQFYGSSGYCSKYCTVTKKDCPSGFTCFGYKDSPNGQGACLPSQGGTQTGKPAGSACNASSECDSLMCLQGTCRVPCTGANAAQKCDLAVEVCTPVPGTSVGVCMPKGSASGKKALGQECSAPDDCDSDLCMKDDLMATVGYCRQSCTGPNTCPIKFHCVQQAAGYQGCLPGTEKMPTGSPCQYTVDCVEGPCIAGKPGASYFCTATCKLDTPSSCPCGMICADKGKGPRCFHGQPLGCLETNDACTGNGECASAICAGGSCRSQCDVLVDALASGCAPDEGCVRLQPGTNDGMCWPKGGVPDQQACSDDKSCVGLFCAQDSAAAGALRCMRPCAPGAPACDVGQGCAALSDKIGVCQVGADTPATDAISQGDALDGFVPTPYQQPAAPSSTCTATRSGQADAPIVALMLLSLLTLGALRRRRDTAEVR